MSGDRLVLPTRPREVSQMYKFIFIRVITGEMIVIKVVEG
jgi:hypothetical protein